MGLQEKTRKIWAASEASRRKKKGGAGRPRYKMVHGGFRAGS